MIPILIPREINRFSDGLLNDFLRISKKTNVYVVRSENNLVYNLIGNITNRMQGDTTKMLFILKNKKYKKVEYYIWEGIVQEYLITNTANKTLNNERLENLICLFNQHVINIPGVSMKLENMEEMTLLTSTLNSRMVLIEKI